MNGNRQNKYDNPVTAILTGLGDLLRKQVPAGELKETDRLTGKTVLVDGSSSGLGFAVAVDVARRGANVIMACRSGIPEKGEKVKELSGNSHVSMLPVDFSDIRSITELVKMIKTGPKIDVLVCNAGMVPGRSRQTGQGLEEMFMVNYFSKYIFVNLLLENGCFSPGEPGGAGHRSDVGGLSHREIPRIIFVSSETHRNPRAFDWEGFGKYREYGMGKSMELYGYYKLLLTTFACELSKRLNHGDEASFSVFALCPGPVNSNIAREAPRIFRPLLKAVLGILFKSPARAAVPVVYLAASPDMEGKPFDYLFRMSRREVDRKASDPANGERLWELSEELRRRSETV